VTEAWLLLSLLGPPIAAALAAAAFRAREAGPVTVIALNAVAPGAGLAAAHRPTLEIVLGVLFAQASLLVTGGPADASFLLPIAAVGGLWASLHTPLSPIALATTNRSRRRPAAGVSGHAVSSGVRGPDEAAREGGSAETTIDEVGYSMTVRCTECGADVDVPVLSHMAQCSFCGSQHLVVGHDETLYVTIPERVTGEEALRDAILDHYRYRHYLALYRRAVAPLEGGATEASESGALVSRPEVDAAVAAAEAAASRKADAYRASLADSLRVQPLQHFLAPYRHGVGTLYQVAFGRSRPDMDKRLRFAVGTIEAATLATTAMDLPRMGKLSYLRALSPAATCAPSLRTLPVDVGEDGLQRAFGDLDRKQLVRDLDVIRLGGAFSDEVSAVIWRPWWIADVEGPGIAETLLVDGAAGSVAGAPPAFDSRCLEELPAVARSPGAGLRFVPMECPTCGHEYPFDTDAVAHFCVNCHRVCVVDGDRKVEVAYSFEEIRDGSGDDVVPFWCFPLRLRTGDGTVITDLAHLKDGIDGRLDQIGEQAPERRHLVLAPAFRCINSRLMASAFQRVFEHTICHPPRLVHGRYSLTERPRPWSVNLDQEEARRLLPLYLAHAFGPRDLARVRVDQVSSWLFDATQEAVGRLTFVTVPRPVTEPFRRYVGRYRSQAVRQALGDSTVSGE
jgi:Zn finger protein HypA/HybF involved in hydrogenase expression